MTIPNYSTYLGAATELQRWRDLLAHTAAYPAFSLAGLVPWTFFANALLLGSDLHRHAFLPDAFM